MDHLRPRPVWAAVTAVTLAAGAGVLAITWSQSPAFAAAPVTAAEVPDVVDERITVGNLSVDRRPVQAGDVDADLSPGVPAERARAEREPLRDTTARDEAGDSGAEAVRTPSDEATSDGPSSDGSSSDGSSNEVDPAAVTRPADVREHAAEVLASLPGGNAVEIAWNHPDIGNHLGGVRLDVPTVMMLNAHRFEAEPERVEATVKHEIAHYYQGAVIAKNADGDWWSGYWKLDAALQPVFGSKWMERSADCVALHLGADWTHYTSDCSGKAKQNAVEALIAGRMP